MEQPQKQKQTISGPCLPGAGAGSEQREGEAAGAGMNCINFFFPALSRSFVCIGLVVVPYFGKVFGAGSWHNIKFKLNILNNSFFSSVDRGGTGASSAGPASLRAGPSEWPPSSGGL